MKMNQVNEKHLEFIQNVIGRHNSNSFRIKGWAITITAAIFALTGTIKEPYLCFVALGPILMFWVLDSMFLANERCFINLYSCVSKGNKLHIEKEKLRKQFRNNIQTKNKEYTVSNYSMNFIQFREVTKNNWWSVLFSYTILWFYLVLTVLTIVTFIGLKSLKANDIDRPLNVNAKVITPDSINISPLDINTKIISIDTVKYRK